MNIQLKFHCLKLLLPCQVHVTPIIHLFQIGFLDAFCVVFELDLVDEREILVLLPGVKVVHLCDHVF